MRYNFLVATEQHARMFLPICKRLGSATLYIPSGSPRNNSINVEINKYKDLKEKFLIKSSTEFLSDSIWAEEYFVTALHLGNSSHPFYNACKDKDKFFETPQEIRKGKLIFMSEHLLFNSPNFISATDYIFTRSKVEFNWFKDKGNKNVFLIGDISLDSTIFKFPKKNVPIKLGVFTSFDVTRAHGEPHFFSIIDEIENWVNKGAFIQEVIVKQHPGDHSFSLIGKLMKYCAKRNIKFSILERNKSIDESIDKINKAIVISSFSTFVNLITNGIESFFYQVPIKHAVNEWDVKFFAKSGMKNMTLKNDLILKLSHEEKIKWIKDTFLVDNKTIDRFLNHSKQ